MKRFILSTIGTSLITSQITEQERKDGWYKIIRDTGNIKEEDALSSKAQKILTILVQRASEALGEKNVSQNRRISAELNGIYGIYNNQLDKARQDMHYLICTDTVQGKAAADLIVKFFHTNDVYPQKYVPDNLSTQDTKSFSTGIKNLIRWCEKIVPSYRDEGYQIVFNLVGGFKSLQGYLNTIGMFYADKIVYIFEAETADLIQIPRLPVKIDKDVIKAYVLKFALMAAGKLYPVAEAERIPESLIEDDGKDATLSSWGFLIWNRAKAELLEGELLDFPMLQYERSFIRDFKDWRNKKERVFLQETLAKVAVILEENNGDTSKLKKDNSLRYENYTNRKDIAHFRVSRGIRVSCTAEGKDGLILRRFGKEPDVNGNP